LFGWEEHLPPLGPLFEELLETRSGSQFE